MAELEKQVERLIKQVDELLSGPEYMMKDKFFFCDHPSCKAKDRDVFKTKKKLMQHNISYTYNHKKKKKDEAASSSSSTPPGEAKT